jgi:hypothetical protein
MSLPINLAPKYQLTLPVSEKTIEFRPFVVKEEKILLLASESKDEKQIIAAIKQVVGNCTFGNLDIDSLPTADIEYLFINLRARSAGESANPNIKCENCEKAVGINVDLTKVDVKRGANSSNKIQLTKTVGVIMRYPTYEMISTYRSENGRKPTLDENFELVARCIDRIYDEKAVYDAKDYTTQEIKDFLESLTQSVFTKISSFFEDMPRLEHAANYECVSCKHKGTIVLRGIQDFFT